MLLFFMIGFLLLGGLYALILRRWRWGIYGIIAFIPFAGLPTLLLYPAPAWTRVLKDLLFVLPAYFSFLLCLLMRPGSLRPHFKAAPAIPIVLFGVLGVIHLLNPALINLMVGLIGLRTWLFYVPMLFLGFHLVTSKAHLISLSKFILFMAAIPAGFGIVQAALYYNGNRELAYAVYGEAASDATQLFTSFSSAGDSFGLVRLPSLFSFVTQYGLFLLSMMPVAYFMAFRPTCPLRARFLYIGVLTLIVLAGFASGARAMFVIMPGFLLLTIVLSDKARRVIKRVIMMGGMTLAGLILMGGFLGGGLGKLMGFISEVTVSYLSGALYENIGTALDATWIGFGPGMATGPARFAFGSVDEAFAASPGIESHYAKAIYELGIPGLLLTLAILGRLLWVGYVHFKRLHDPDLKIFGAGLFALLITTAVYLMKGSVLDYDPLNIYFWLFAGMLMKLPQLEEAGYNP